MHVDGGLPGQVKTYGPVSLRTWCDDDVVWYADLVADPEVMRFIGDGQARDVKKAQAEIRGFRSEQDGRGWSRWAVDLRSERRGIGFVGFSERRGEIDWGGRTIRRLWGSGIPIVAAVAALEMGLLELRIPAAVALTNIRNDRAWRLNEALGFTMVETVDVEGQPHMRQMIERTRFVASGQAARNQWLADRVVARHRRLVTAA